MHYVEVVINHYYNLNKSITLEELQTLYRCIYPNSKVKLNKEDLAVCSICIDTNNYQKICDEFELINNRIDISKSSSLQTSEIFINKLIKELEVYQKDIYGEIQPFCDGKEQGLLLAIYNQLTDDVIYVWACESKTNKDLMIVTSREKTNQNLYLDYDYNRAQYYNNGNYIEALNYCKKEVESFLDKNLMMKL